MQGVVQILWGLFEGGVCIFLNRSIIKLGVFLNNSVRIYYILKESTIQFNVINNFCNLNGSNNFVNNRKKYLKNKIPVI